ncbi:MAG: aminotransferase class I/II-fold pyridoxal phosphate-dependent enzyme [Clostridiales bacterium]|jgi:arginine/lysine/ornithine decarboxylase|nr:aminotransferase class I/II-fold pyridoxal phosphate-dependent enzyme [Clostridiales bacterium]
MDKKLQARAPIYEALLEMREKRIVPFDVPGHKRGKGNKPLTEFLGEKCMSTDVNSMKPLDNLCQPKSVIKEAEDVAADAFGCKKAFFMVGGTTSCVQAMILFYCKKGDKIIMPRNVHRSSINALVLCGAKPVYVNPQTHTGLGISLGMSVADVERAILQNPDAKAVLVNNPTYYGVCSDIKKITETAHAHGMAVLADEAHGAHFYFGENLPLPAMAAGADMAAVSMHKSGGSLTQSSFLLVGDGVNQNYMRQIINLTQTTSASYLLLSSLDISRRNLALNGGEIFRSVCRLSEYARDEINKIGDYYAFSKEITDGDSIYDFDVTKLSINVDGLGLAGIEVCDILRDDYEIQVEFGDLSNVLAYISVGDRERDIERLVSAFLDIRRRYKRPRSDCKKYEYIPPDVVCSPQEAFYGKKRRVALAEGIGGICGEFVMCYPPGIPVIAPGERLTGDIIEYISLAKSKGCLLTGPEDADVEKINILEE